MPRTRDTEARHSQIVAAAARVFARRGVANTTVRHVVEEAGVAQGTFYLYFDCKEDVVAAVAAQLVGTILDRVEASAATSSGSAAARFLAITAALAAGAADPKAADLVEFLHRSENRAVHDRMAEHLLPRLAVLCETIIAEGVEAGEFSVADPRAAAWFVLGGLHGMELSGTSPAEMPDALRQASMLALRALGHAASGG